LPGEESKEDNGSHNAEIFFAGRMDFHCGFLPKIDVNAYIMLHDEIFCKRSVLDKSFISRYTMDV